MAESYFFYDLETSGLNPREDRIMQFAGQRTDMNLEPIGEPYNILVRLDDDTIPSPDAIMVTGITPQKTVEEGYPEAEFAKILIDEVFTEGTIAVGYNNVRFDDEFIRYLLWRNFYDPYEWSWRYGRSRWDLLDVVRLTRALRPEGIKWPVDADGNPTNRLELLTVLNGIDHINAHDALADVTALIRVARLVRDKQPQLYEYLLKLRSKREVAKLVNLEDKQPFVYTSGRYDSQWNKTTIAWPLTSAPNGNAVVYDLRVDPTDLLDLDTEQLNARLYANYEQRQKQRWDKLPLKVLQYNRCPAVAPVGVLERDDGWSKIGMTDEIVRRHIKILTEHPEFGERMRTIFETERQFEATDDPEAKLYDGFLDDRDKLRVEKVRWASLEQLADMHPEFTDERLAPLLLHYKARNYPKSLSESELALWEEWRQARLERQLSGAVSAMNRLAKTADDDKQFLLQEIQLWIESIAPLPTDGN